MSRTREMIQEIIEIRQRRGSDAIGETFRRLLQLERAFESRRALSPELLKHFPVGLVACMEGFFRLAIKRLVDNGGVYLDRSERLFSNVKLDFQALRALHGKEITIGDLVAHQVSLSRIESINSHISILIGKDFFTELRSVKEVYWTRSENQSPKPLLVEPDSTFRRVRRIFELRHIVCHELATEFVIELGELEECVFGTILFLKTAEEYLEELLNPGVRYMSNVEMKNAAHRELEGLLQEVERISQEIVVVLRLREQEASGLGSKPSFVEDFLRASEIWKKYVDVWAVVNADGRYFGGTGWGLGYSMAAAACARMRIDDLNGLRKELTTP